MSPHSGNTGFTPLSPNPYIVGNPIRDRVMFYGREVEFDIVRRRFKETPDEGGLLVFCGERRSGKTSILFQILNGRLGEDFIPVLIDMQSMAIDDEIGFLKRIVNEVVSGLGPGAQAVPPPDFSDGKPSAVFHRFVGDVLKMYPRKKLILLVDEYELLENKIDGGVLSEDVLLILSHLMENLAVFLIFTGSVNLEERRREYWKRFLAKSSFRKISFLDRKDALRLIMEPVKDRIRWEDGVVDSIFRQTGGQPFYTQGICQGIVDQLNERESDEATPAVVDAVVLDIINNPFPQMLFRWDILKADEKLSLSLLAEALESDKEFVSAQKVHGWIRRRRYPLDLDPARVAAALEGLFESDMLIKDEASPPGYAFRMDLWRRWIRRMHSTWQVLRELGMKARHRPGQRRPLYIALAGVVLIAGAISLFALLRGRPDNQGPAAPLLAPLVLTAEPDSALITYDGDKRGRGLVNASLAAGRHDVLFTCPGYRDSAFTVDLPPAGVSLVVALSPRLGAARIETTPSGARVLVNGTDHGLSPVLVRDLPVPHVHRIEASLAGFARVTSAFSVRPDTTVLVRVPLDQTTVDLLLSTVPDGARIFLDGTAQGTSPRLLSRVTVGLHTFRAELTGYLPQETKAEVSEKSPGITLTLRAEPAGAIVLKGEAEARMQIDEGTWSSWLYRWGPHEVRGGEHVVRIELRGGEERRTTIRVPPGRMITFNYESMSVESETEWKPQNSPSGP